MAPLLDDMTLTAHQTLSSLCPLVGDPEPTDTRNGR